MKEIQTKTYYMNIYEGTNIMLYTKSRFSIYEILKTFSKRKSKKY